MIGPDIPAHLLQGNRSTTSEDEQEEGPPAPGGSSIGPGIPPHLSQPNRSTTPDDGPSLIPSGTSIGPAIPSEILAKPAPSQPEEEEEEEDDYAPALPPELLAARASASSKPSASAPSSSPRRHVGPTFPSQYNRYDDDDSDDDVGPMPLPEGVVLQEKDGVQEFLEKEERRRKQIEVSFYITFPSRSTSLCVDSTYFVEHCSYGRVLYIYCTSPVTTQL